MALNSDQRKELLLDIEENQLLNDLFNHPGMRPLLVKVKEIHDANNTIKDIKSLEDLHYRRGQMDILEWLLNYQQVVLHTLEGQVEIAESEVRLQKIANGTYND